MSLPPTLSSAPPIAESKPRIVLLDGDSRLAETLVEPMTQAGYEVEVHDKPGNLTPIVASGPDLVLVDIRIGDGAGFEVCGEIRTLEPGRHTPIILLTREPTDEQLVSRGLLCGADDCLSVTGRLLEFQARVRVQLRNKRDRDRVRRLRAERNDFRREAIQDALTGLLNRRAIDLRLDDLALRGDPFALIFVDVDHFKSVNDTFGHDVGDEVLRAVAGALRQNRDPGHEIGRWGGEEFVILTGPITSLDSCLDPAERYRAAVAELSLPRLRGRKVTASFGVAWLDPRSDGDVDRLVQRADAALYRAKNGGRNRVELAVSRPPTVPSPAVPSLSPRDLLEAELLQKLASGRAGLPLLPEAAAAALRLAEDPATDISRIAKLVDRDPSLAARFVAVASSAVYSRGYRATSTQGALVRIGLSASRDLLLQIVYERANEELPFFRSQVARSFQRSVREAVAARVVAREIGPYEYAYLAALLRDIGEARIYRILAQLPSAIEAPEIAEDLVVKHHGKAGADVARAWNLPLDIVHVCESHHGPAEAHRLPIRVVQSAEIFVELAELVGEKPLDEVPLPEESVAALVRLGFKPERLRGVLDGVIRALKDASTPTR
jgi:diguanylate cyclase (GGDEF)-like protein